VSRTTGAVVIATVIAIVIDLFVTKSTLPRNADAPQRKDSQRKTEHELANRPPTKLLKLAKSTIENS